MRNGKITKTLDLIEIRANVVYYSKMMGFKISPTEMDSYLFIVCLNQDWELHPISYDEWEHYSCIERSIVRKTLASLEKKGLVERSFGAYKNSEGRNCPNMLYVKANDTSLYIRADIVKKGNPMNGENSLTAAEIYRGYLGAMA